MQRRIFESAEKKQQLQEEKERTWSSIENTIPSSLKNQILQKLQEEENLHRQIVTQSHNKKLTTLNGGRVRQEQKSDGFINLSNVDLTNEQKKLLNLGLNCHYIRKPHRDEKRIQTEILIEKLQKLHEDSKIAMKPECIPELIGEANRNRGKFYSKIMIREMKQAAKKLKENSEIIIRKADKAALYVVVNRSEYNEKLDRILSDTTKFERIKKDPTSQLKSKMIRLTTEANKHQNTFQFPKIGGEYKPGYCYATVKTHKPNNPIRPIISQITSPTYKVAKVLNQIITPYIPQSNVLKSATEFVDIIQSHSPGHDIASLDVESLFTNVPVDETIKIMLRRVYQSEKEPPPIPEKTMEAMLNACTKEAPFTSHRNELFRQRDGVAMGSPLGVLFANAYMNEVEERTFEKTRKPKIYARYVDDIFVAIDKPGQSEELAKALCENSCLNFTIEKSKNGSLPFLDVQIKQENNTYRTEVYTKKTNAGRCLNAKGECPDAFKRSVVDAFVKRALTHCSTWRAVHKEIERASQVLTNNGYKDDMVQQVIRDRMNKLYGNNDDNRNQIDSQNKIIIYHNLPYHERYEDEKKAYLAIIKRGIKAVETYQINVRIYCKPNTTASTVMKNNIIGNVEKS